MIRDNKGNPILASQEAIDATQDATRMCHYDPALSTHDVLLSACRQTGASIQETEEWARVKSEKLNPYRGR